MPRWLPLLLGGLGILAIMVFLSAKDPMPGDLAAPHAAVPELSGIRNCDACHREPGFEVACLDCHAAIGDQIAAGRGLHATFHADGDRDCSMCHREHLGHDFDLVGTAAWRDLDKESFAHEHVAFGLHGAHEALACEACHRPELAGDAWPAARGATAPRAMSYLGLTQSCGACHVDVHGPATSNDCASCHAQDGFVPAPSFDHEAVFSLAGAHARVACDACHRGGSADPVVTRPFDDVAGTRCVDCHENPHTRPNERMYGNDCRSCHTSESFRPHRFAVERHPEGFPLLGAHREAACASCHTSERATLVGTTSTACGACHDNAHEPGGSGMRIADAADCARCHSGGTWQVPGFAERAHIDAGFPLAGAHDDVACVDCHRPDAGLAANATQSCTACHADPHSTSFASACTTCHRLEDEHWNRGALRVTADLHARTGFALAPPHENPECVACHGTPSPYAASAQTPVASRPTASRDIETLASAARESNAASTNTITPSGDYAARFPGRTLDDCAACHVDSHAGQFLERPGGCAACHEGTHFVPAAFAPSDHTTFPLDGGHLAVSCVRCHRKPAADAPRQFRGTPNACASCHDNPHGNRFRDEIARGGCAACHTTAAGWRVDAFDHAITGYPLEGAHAKAACADCHRPSQEQQGARGADRYTPVSRDCASCHRDPHFGQLTSTQPDCTRCHDSFARWSANAFDHQIHTRFELDGVHRDVACSKCHTERTTPNGTRYIHYRPMGRSCEDCHAVR